MTTLLVTVSITWDDVWSVGKYALAAIGGAFVLLLFWASKARPFG